LATIYHATPQACAESVRDAIARRNRFTACIFGPPGSGKTSALASVIHAARDVGVTSAQIAAFAPWPAIERLRALAGGLQPDLSGIPIDAMRRYSAQIGSHRLLQPEAIASGYIGDVLAPLNDITVEPTETEARFLESLKPRVLAAIQADHDARLGSQALPRNAYLECVADYASNYKSHRRLLDKADLIRGNYYSCKQVRLLCLDEISPDDAVVMRRYFPNASVIVASQQETEADIAIGLPRCLRKPEKIEIEAGPLTTVPPPPNDFGSLFILASPGRRSAWLSWLRGQGLPAPFRLSRWPAEHAGAVLARYDRLSHLPIVRFGSPASVRGIEAEFVITESASWADDELRDIALSRATRRLMIISPKNS